jgi:hypothetical protein
MDRTRKIKSHAVVVSNPMLVQDLSIKRLHEPFPPDNGSPKTINRALEVFT